VKVRKIDELVSAHNRIVELVEQDGEGRLKRLGTRLRSFVM
jgi:hypothetical protein